MYDTIHLQNKLALFVSINLNIEVAFAELVKGVNIKYMESNSTSLILLLDLSFM